MSSSASRQSKRIKRKFSDKLIKNNVNGNNRSVSNCKRPKELRLIKKMRKNSSSLMPKSV